MTEHDLQAAGMRPAGYVALIARFHLDVIPNWHQSFVATGNTHRIDTTEGMSREVYPARYWPGDTLGDQEVTQLEDAVRSAYGSSDQ